MIEIIFQALGLSKASAIAGAIGAGIAAMRKKCVPMGQRVILFIVGFGVALYLPKIIIILFKLPEDPNFYAAVGFIFGYFGPALLDGMTDVMDKTKQVDWKEVITSWVKRG